MRSVYDVKSSESGSGLGVDPICRGPKVCNFNCTYCRLGRGGMMVSRRSKFVAEEDLANDFMEHVGVSEVDHITFRGTGEPLLAENLGEIVGALRKLTDKKMSVITNCTLLNEDDALAEILKFDVIIAKIDAATEATFQKVNRPCGAIHLDDVISGAKRARKTFKGDFHVKTHPDGSEHRRGERDRFHHQRPRPEDRLYRQADHGQHWSCAYQEGRRGDREGLPRDGLRL
jgi:wyosine [tRNA(Phe)-imidazoG37] synthetase (radical SAM superfamily)